MVIDAVSNTTSSVLEAGMPGIFGESVIDSPFET